MSEIDELREENERLKAENQSLREQVMAEYRERLYFEAKVTNTPLPFVFKGRIPGLSATPIKFMPGAFQTKEEFWQDRADFETGPLIAEVKEHIGEWSSDPKGVWGELNRANEIVGRIAAEAQEAFRVESADPAEPQKPYDPFDPKNWGM